MPQNTYRAGGLRAKKMGASCPLSTVIDKGLVESGRSWPAGVCGAIAQRGRSTSESSATSIVARLMRDAV